MRRALKEHACGCAGCYTALQRARAVRRGVRRRRRARQAGRLRQLPRRRLLRPAAQPRHASRCAARPGPAREPALRRGRAEAAARRRDAGLAAGRGRCMTTPDAMTPNRLEPEARIALLIDADNSPAKKIDVILAELANFGVANIRRAYGNWTKRELKGWEDALHDYAIRPMQQFDYSQGQERDRHGDGDRGARAALHRPAGRLRHRLVRRRLHAAGDAPARQGRGGVRLRRAEDARALRQRVLELPVPRTSWRARAAAVESDAGKSRRATAAPAAPTARTPAAPSSSRTRGW